MQLRRTRHDDVRRQGGNDAHGERHMTRMLPRWLSITTFVNPERINSLHSYAYIETTREAVYHLVRRGVGETCDLVLTPDGTLVWTRWSEFEELES